MNKKEALELIREAHDSVRDFYLRCIAVSENLEEFQTFLIAERDKTGIPEKYMAVLDKFVDEME